jgi:dTDP-4-dehydrorhamnose 3,5-epimerase
VKDLKKNPDERGFFVEAMREDWKDFLGGDRIVQSNISMSYPGVIRAWHRHKLGQVDYFVVLEGALKICIYDDREGSETKGQLQELVASGERLQVVRVPGHYWHGIKTVSSMPSLTFYLVTNLYNYENPDEERRSWNDPSIIDPRTGKPYDWNKPPHR